MKIKIVLSMIALLSLSAFLAAHWPSEAGAAPPQEGTMPDASEMKDMMVKMTAAMTPSEHHRHLDPFVGEWNITVKVWMGGPGAPPAETRGTASVRWVLDRRFLMEEMKYTMMLPDVNNPTQLKKVDCAGMGLTGYDNYKNMYVSTWADNINTHLLTMRGVRHPSGKLFTYYGEMDEPMLDVAGRTVKYQTRIVDDNRHVFSIYDLHAGDDYKVVEIAYTRK